jgi:hypothetical protein
MRNAPSPIRATNTYNDNPEQYVREMPIPMPPEAPAPGLVTEVERAAELALEVAEAVAEGLSPWALASHAVSLLAAGARALRARR